MSLNQQYAATLGDLLMRQADVQAESARERARIGNAKGQLWGNFLGGIAKLITEAPERDLQRQETAARIQQLGDISAARKAQAQQANDAAAGQEELASLLKDPQFGGDLQKVAGELNLRGRVGMATSLLKQASEQTTASNAMLTAKDAQRQRVADRLSLIDPNSQDDPYAALAALHQDGIDPSLLDEVTRAFDSMDTASAIKKFGATAPGTIAAKKAQIADENKIREIPRGGAIGRGTDPANYIIPSPIPADTTKGPSVGSFEDYLSRTYGANPTSAQILEARKAYNQADDRAPRVTVSTGGGAAFPPNVQARIDAKGKEFNTQPVVKRIQQMAEAMSFANGFDANTKNPADDQALIYAFAKAMDPDSVVREGEYATVQKYAQSWADNFGFNAQRIFSNSTFLTPEARANMKATIEAKYRSALPQYKNLRKNYLGQMDALTNGKGNDWLVDYEAGFAPQAQTPPPTTDDARARARQMYRSREGQK